MTFSQNNVRERLARAEIKLNELGRDLHSAKGRFEGLAEKDANEALAVIKDLQEQIQAMFQKFDQVRALAAKLEGAESQGRQQ